MILLSGAQGPLARQILPMLRDSQPVCAFDREQGDVSDAGFISRLLDESTPEAFVYCSDFEGLEQCERDLEGAYRSNAFVPADVARQCGERGVFFIYLSTSHVFAGNAGRPYREDDETAPLSAYGDSKLLGERLLKESGVRHAVVRLAEPFGREQMFFGGNFPWRLCDGVFKTIRDCVVSVVSTSQISEALLGITAGKAEGLFHCAGEGSCRASEFLGAALEALGRRRGTHPAHRVEELSYEEFTYPSERPMYAALDCGKLSSLLGRPLAHWREAMEESIARFGADL